MVLIVVLVGECFRLRIYGDNSYGIFWGLVSGIWGGGRFSRLRVVGFVFISYFWRFSFFLYLNLSVFSLYRVFYSFLVLFLGRW